MKKSLVKVAEVGSRTSERVHFVSMWVSELPEFIHSTSTKHQIGVVLGASIHLQTSKDSCLYSISVEGDRQ